VLNELVFFSTRGCDISLFFCFCLEGSIFEVGGSEDGFLGTVMLTDRVPEAEEKGGCFYPAAWLMDTRSNKLIRDTLHSGLRTKS